MAGLGVLFAGLSGAGKALAASAAQDEQAAREQELMRERSRLEEERMLRIEEARRVAQRQAGIRQGQEISAGAAALQSQRNQQDADRINTENANVIGGSNITAADAATLRNAPEAARKAYGLLNSTRQSELEDRATAAENLGYLDAAKETRGLLQTEIQNQRNKDVDESNNRRLDRQEKKDEEDRKFRQQHENRMARVAEAGISFQQQRAKLEDARMEKMDADSKRMYTSKALDGANEYAKELTKTVNAPEFGMLPKPEQDNIKIQLDAVRSEQTRLRNALAGAGVDGSTAPPKAFNPADFRLGKTQGGQSASGGSTVPNPMAMDQQTTSRASPKDQAKSTLDSAIDTTVRQLTAANNRGDKQEAERLNRQLIEQQNAKKKLYD